MSKNEPPNGSTPRTPTGGSSDVNAFVRLAEELGRLVGRFLAEEAATPPKPTPPPAPDSDSK